MMKKTLILAVVMMLALGAAANAYILQAKFELPNGTSGYQLQFGDVPPGSIGNWTALMPPYLGAALLDGDTKYIKLFKVPEPPAYEAIVWGTPDLPDTTARLMLWCQQLGNNANTGRNITQDPRPWMILGPGGEVLWTGAITAVGSKTSPLVTLEIPIVKTAEPSRATAPVYTFTQIPEPGSMIALCSGLIGLAGFGIRRRK